MSRREIGMDEMQSHAELPSKTNNDEEWQIRFTSRGKNLFIDSIPPVVFLFLAGSSFFVILRTGFSSANIMLYVAAVLASWMVLVSFPWLPVIIEKKGDNLWYIAVHGIFGIKDYRLRIAISEIISWDFFDEKQLLRFRIHYSGPKSNENSWKEFSLYVNGIKKKDPSFLTDWLTRNFPRQTLTHKK
jgi:hypothetical protein